MPFLPKKLSMKKIAYDLQRLFFNSPISFCTFLKKYISPIHERRRMSDFNSIGIWLLSFLKHIQVFHEFQMPH